MHRGTIQAQHDAGFIDPWMRNSDDNDGVNGREWPDGLAIFGLVHVPGAGDSAGDELARLGLCWKVLEVRSDGRLM
ncbi:hypothetical protein SAMN05444166_0719 [Singulisphaera sp. GP187]|nr:hypothetical protein SAMN05444166_0719 [Singulisphaera sp. GP187]